MATPRRSLRRTVAWASVVVVLATATYVIARTKRDFWDFQVYRTAGDRALRAEPLYRIDDGHYQFKYWPAFAFAMIPFAVIGEEAGKVTWYALSIALLALFMRQSIHALPDRRSTVSFLTWWSLLLTAKFIVRELVNGQTNILLGVLAMAALVAAERGRDVRAGVFAGLAVFVKPYALLLLPWLAVSRGMRAAAAAGAVLLAGLVLPSLTYGWEGNLDLLQGWYATVAATTTENLTIPENISFAAMWAKWIGPTAAASVLAVLTTAVAIASAAALWLFRRGVRAPAYLEVSYLLLLVPLVSPQGWDYVLLIALPAFVCLVDRFKGSPWTWKAPAIAGVFLVSFTVYDLFGRTMYYWMMDRSLVSVGAILLAVGLFGLRVRAAA